MKFLANENFPLKSIIYLESKGFDINSIGRDIPGIKDEFIMSLADEQERIILTFDRDYGELIFKFHYKPKNGVIYLRLDDYTPELPGKLIERLIGNSHIDFANKLTVLDKNGIRQRKY